MSNLLSLLGNTALSLLGTPGAIIRNQGNTQDVGNVMSGSQIPSYLQTPGPDQLTPDQIQAAKINQLYQLGTPEAVKLANTYTAPQVQIAQAKLPSEIGLNQANIGNINAEASQAPSRIAANYASAANQRAEASTAPSKIGLSQAQTDLAKAQAGVANMQAGSMNMQPIAPTSDIDGVPHVETRPAEVAQAFNIKPDQMNVVQIRAQRMIDGLEDPTKVSRTDPIAVAAANLAKVVKPDLDATTFKNRQQTAAAFGPEGKLGQSVVNLNTAAGHINELMSDYAALHNVSDKNSMFPALRNKIGNAIRNTKEAGPLTNFDMTVSKLSDELQSAYVPGGGSAKERGSNKEDYNSNASIETQLGSARTAADLVISKMEGLDNARVKGYGRVVPATTLYTPETLDTLRKYASPAQAAKLDKYGPTPTENIPTGGNIGANINQPPISEGQTATNPKTGQKIVFRGGKWQ